ncbi:MAG: tetratricopeptide repeat protein [Flavobacteriales bacterium]
MEFCPLNGSISFLMRHRSNTLTALACVLVLLRSSSASAQSMEELLPKIQAEKSDSARFYLAFSGLTVSETNPVLDMHNADVLLVHGQVHNDKVSQVLGLLCLGYDYREFGSTAKALEYNIKGVALAEETGDPRLLASAYAGVTTNYLDLQEYPKAIAYGRRSVANAAKVEVNMFTIVGPMFLGETYLAAGKLDSALIYTQKAYELTMSSGIKDYLGAIYGQLGMIQARMGDARLAENYIQLAVEEGHRINSPKYINIPYTALAEYHAAAGRSDSAIVYAKKAITIVQGTPFSTMVMKPAQLLTDLYRSTNVDSAFKYSEMYKVANDSLYNFKAIQQTQLMTFEEDARQQELAVVKAQEDEQRHENIQYALIALGIVVFILLFLVLSRSYIASAKVISFLSVVALLIVFEFLNLVLHPVIGSITHHTPLLMLLALVCIAALLVPLHHRLEKWATKRLVEKNVELRLAKAKKTVEALEKPAMAIASDNH